jgi:hypothetical protein
VKVPVKADEIVIVRVVFTTGEYVAGETDVTEATLDEIDAVLAELVFPLIVAVKVSVDPAEAVANAPV